MLDVWSGDGEGIYDMQMPGQDEMLCRGKFRTDAEGRYWFRSIRPVYYPVPTDGPVGDMLRKMGRHPNRPGHIHMIVSAPGYQTVATHLFVKGAPYLDSDAVFAVKDSLIVDFERHEPGEAPDRRGRWTCRSTPANTTFAWRRRSTPPGRPRGRPQIGGKEHGTAPDRHLGAAAGGHRLGPAGLRARDRVSRSPPDRGRRVPVLPGPHA